MNSIIVQPITANIMNAAMCGLFSFGLLITPQKFMQGGRYQKTWFKTVPEERDNKVFYIAQFFAFLMFGGIVFPTFLNPHSQFLCYQAAVFHGISLLHTMIFMCTDTYKNARPVEAGSKSQWYFMNMVVGLSFFIVTVLACLHSTDNVVDSGETYITKTVANTLMLCFSSIFGVLFILAPRYLLSFFWEDETLQNPETLLGFKLLNMTDLEAWWSRCVGCAILCLNLGVLVDFNIAQPLYTAGSLVTVSCLTLLNLHQVTMRPYRSISTRQVCLSWIPNILMSGVVIGVLASACLYV